jgi:glycosyltransferase involved in cell wall biosynthesis
MILNLAIVITTRNRRENLEKLLNSIALNSLQPDFVSIVSSGESVIDLIDKYSKKINIIHKHVVISGQVYQRNIGIEALQKNIDLVAFLDDYVILDKNFIRECVSSFTQISDKIVGMGMTVTNIKQKNPKLITLRRFIKNYSTRGGSVLVSGSTTPYQDLPKFSPTEWLNGTSVWRSYILTEFSHPDMSGSYSAYEDLIFSYEVSKKYDLCTNRDLKISYSDRILSPRNYFNRAFVSNLHKLYFIEKNNNLSKFWFYVNYFFTLFAVILRFFFSPSKITMYILFGHMLSAKYFLKYEFLRWRKKISKYWLLRQT